MYLKTLETCIEIYELDTAHFLSALGLAWQDFSKKTEVKLELLTRYWWLKKELEAKYVMQYIEMPKKVMNIWRIMIIISHHHTSCI